MDEAGMESETWGCEAEARMAAEGCNISNVGACYGDELNGIVPQTHSKSKLVEN